MADHAPSTTGHAHAEHVGEESHGVGHIVSPKILIATALALLVLTALTVTAAKVAFDKLEMHELTIIVCLGIAAVKATLVCMFFMHLRGDRPFTAFILVASLAFVVLFISFAITDSSEYQPDIIKEESATIQGELAKLPPPLPESALHSEAPAGH